MTKVNFYDDVQDSLLKFAVIIAKYNGKLVFCKHKERSTWEVPGGHREHGEDILDTAKKELWEETGAISFEINPVCIYSVTAPDNFNGIFCMFAKVNDSRRKNEFCICSTWR